MARPSGVNAGAGNESQSTSSQKSLDQSADHTLTLWSALAASHSSGAVIPRSCSSYENGKSTASVRASMVPPPHTGSNYFELN